MGVKKLKGFIEEHNNKGILRLVNLTKWKTIVVDGNSLCHYLFYGKKCDWHCHYLFYDKKCDWQLGGEYPDFFTLVKDYFKNIVDAGVKPVVIFDGTRDQKKTDTVVNRKEKKNEAMKEWQETGIPSKDPVSPILMLQTFMDALQEMNIDYHIAPGEGDKEVVAVANSHNCPVLANDCDFFMYELTEGYIPLEYFSTAKCLVYHVNYLADYFKLKNPKFRLFLPAILGNDTIKPPRARRWKTALDVIELVQKAANYHEIIKQCGESVERNYKLAEEQYCEPVLMSHAEKKRSYEATYALPEWTFDCFLHGTFHPHLLDIIQYQCCTLGNVVEEISKRSAWSCSKVIREKIYAFIGVTQPVVECVRSDNLPNVVRKKIEVPSTPSSSLKNFQEEDREDIVLTILGCEGSAREILHELDEEWRLPILTVRYWYQHSVSEISDNLLRSLLLCFLHCSGVLDCPTSIPEPGAVENFEVLHAFAEWQCVYYDAMVLNDTVKKPFLFKSPAYLFSGKVVMFFASSAESWDLDECSVYKVMWDFCTKL